jgi:hypothetical protein
MSRRLVLHMRLSIYMVVSMSKSISMSMRFNVHMKLAGKMPKRDRNREGFLPSGKLAY